MNEELLKQYAEFAVRVGVNPQKGQTMLISCSVESAPFARLCARVAFEANSKPFFIHVYPFFYCYLSFPIFLS